MGQLEEKGFQILTNAIDICHSPDDEADSGKGYYLVNTESSEGNNETSDLYATREKCEEYLGYWQRKWGVA